MSSLNQKVFIAKRKGEDEVVLTLAEAQATLDKIRDMDLRLAKYMEYVPEDVLKADTEKLWKR